MNSESPSPVDYRTCCQGAWNNCWMLAALAGLAFHRPEDVWKLIRVLDEGRVEVTLPGKPPVVVRPDECGGTTSDGIWASAIEAAASRFTTAAASRVLSFGEGIALLTGHTRTGYTNVSGAGFAPLARLRSRAAWFEERIADATARSRVMVLGGSDGFWTSVKVEGLANRHCYALLAFEPAERTCRLRDPLGADDRIPLGRKRGGYGPGEFWLAPTEVEASFCGLAIEDA